MNTIDVPQGSPEWLQARAGLVTASRISDILARVKTGEAASRRNYKAQIVAEILTGQPQESGFTSQEMRWGTEQEPYARAAYEIQKNVMVDQVGLVLHPTIARCGASPDGLVDPDGLVEIKCPNTATHIENLIAKAAPAHYHNQMLWQMACTGRAWCDFVSFDPRMPERLQILVVRFPRDEERIKAMEEEVSRFLAEVNSQIALLEAAA